MPVPHNKITFDKLDVKAAAVLESGYWPRTLLVQWRENLQDMLANERAVVGSGLAALRIALLSLV